jgi:hypothetical protein
MQRNCLIATVNGIHHVVLKDQELFEDEKGCGLLAIGLAPSTQKLSLHSMYVQTQRSMPLFSPQLLQSLYIKGYGTLVVKLLVMLRISLDKNQKYEG